MTIALLCDILFQNRQELEIFLGYRIRLSSSLWEVWFKDFYYIWRTNFFYFNSTHIVYFSFEVGRRIHTRCHLPYYYAMAGSNSVAIVYIRIPVTNNPSKVGTLCIRLMVLARNYFSFFSLVLVVRVFATKRFWNFGFSTSPNVSACKDVTGLLAIFTSLVKNLTNWLKEGNWLIFSSISITLRFHLTVSHSGNFESIFLFSL